MRICENCSFKLGDNAALCPFCGGKTHPAPAQKKNEPKPEQPYAKCNVCGFKLSAKTTVCPFCGGVVAVNGGAEIVDKPKTEYQLLQEKAAEMGLKFAPNIGKEKLKELIEKTEKALEDKAALESRTEEELRVAAAEAGIEINADDGKAVIVEKILQAAKDE